MNVSENSWIGAISLAAALSAAAATGDTIRVVPADPDLKALPLPRSAKLHDRDRSGQRWEFTGEIPAALAVARRDFEVVLNRQGWRRKHTTPTGVPGQAAELQTWTRGGTSLHLLLSEDAPGRTTFHAGRETPR